MKVDPANEGQTMRRDSIAAIVDAPKYALPWLDRLYDESDARLLEALAAGPRPAHALIEELDGIDVASLRRAHRRGVVTFDDEHDLTSSVAVTPFWDRFTYWITFEGWRDIPPEAQGPLGEGYLQHYVESIEVAVADVKAGRPISDDTTYYHYVLFSEAQALVRGAGRAFVRPCVCRRTYQRCGTPTDVCLWFDDDEREAGWEISIERALELLHEAERAGLTFTSDSTEPGHASWICCCCSDCCLPILVSREAGRDGDLASAPSPRGHRPRPLHALSRLREALSVRRPHHGRQGQGRRPASGRRPNAAAAASVRRAASRAPSRWRHGETP